MPHFCYHLATAVRIFHIPFRVCPCACCSKLHLYASYHVTHFHTVTVFILHFKRTYFIFCFLHWFLPLVPQIYSDVFIVKHKFSLAFYFK